MLLWLYGLSQLPRRDQRPSLLAFVNKAHFSLVTAYIYLEQEGVRAL
jgi:hypothetical protein